MENLDHQNTRNKQKSLCIVITVMYMYNQLFIINLHSARPSRVVAEFFATYTAISLTLLPFAKRLVVFRAELHSMGLYMYLNRD